MIIFALSRLLFFICCFFFKYPFSSFIYVVCYFVAVHFMSSYHCCRIEEKEINWNWSAGYFCGTSAPCWPILTQDFIAKLHVKRAHLSLLSQGTGLQCKTATQHLYCRRPDTFISRRSVKADVTPSHCTHDSWSPFTVEGVWWAGEGHVVTRLPEWRWRRQSWKMRNPSILSLFCRASTHTPLPPRVPGCLVLFRRPSSTFQSCPLSSLFHPLMSSKPLKQARPVWRDTEVPFTPLRELPHKYLPVSESEMHYLREIMSLHLRKD